MTLIEAWNAAFCNRTVKHGSRKAVIYGKSLRWVGESGSYDDLVPVAEGLLDGWELVPEPPKRYDFEKALAMMRQGKWMRPVGGNGCYNARSESGKWLESDTNGIIHSHCVLFALYNTDMMWEERP